MVEDTKHGTTAREFYEVLKDEGFKKAVTVEHRLAPTEEEGERRCDLSVWWHPTDYIMAVVEEYLLHGERENILNTATIYFNMKPTDKHVFIMDGLTSGTLKGDIWAGEQSVLRDLRFKLKELRRKGELIKWEHFPDVWVKHYLDPRENENILKEIIPKFSAEVLEGTNGLKEN